MFYNLYFTESAILSIMKLKYIFIILERNIFNTRKQKKNRYNLVTSKIIQNFLLINKLIKHINNLTNYVMYKIKNRNMR